MIDMYMLKWHILGPHYRPRACVFYRDVRYELSWVLYCITST